MISSNDEFLSEIDSRFPSGRWAGYWEQDGRRARMKLDLRFAGGKLTGDGRDVVGEFVLSGGYETKSGKCGMCKTYLGQHDVDYAGLAAHDGIRGLWRIAIAIDELQFEDSGCFHIWPVGRGAGEELTTAAEVTA
jgi:hypothetical protein